MCIQLKVISVPNHITFTLPTNLKEMLISVGSITWMSGISISGMSVKLNEPWIQRCCHYIFFVSFNEFEFL